MNSLGGPASDEFSIIIIQSGERTFFNFGYFSTSPLYISPITSLADPST